MMYSLVMRLPVWVRMTFILPVVSWIVNWLEEDEDDEDDSLYWR